MIVRYSEEELLEMMMERLGVYVEPCGVEITSQQGENLQRSLRQRLRARYLQLLETGNPELLPVRDISMQSGTFGKVDGGVGVIELPDSVLRVVEVKMAEWPVGVCRFEDVASVEGERVRYNPYSRSVSRPRVLKQGHRLWLYNVNGTDGRLMAERLIVVMQPTEGVYEMDERCVEEIVRDERY